MGRQLALDPAIEHDRLQSLTSVREVARRAVPDRDAAGRSQPARSRPSSTSSHAARRMRRFAVEPVDQGALPFDARSATPRWPVAWCSGPSRPPGRSRRGARPVNPSSHSLTRPRQSRCGVARAQRLHARRRSDCCSSASRHRTARRLDSAGPSGPEQVELAAQHADRPRSRRSRFAKLSEAGTPGSFAQPPSPARTTATPAPLRHPTLSLRSSSSASPTTGMVSGTRARLGSSCVD